MNRIHKTKSGIDCPARTVKEDHLQAAVVQAINELIEEKDRLLPKVQAAIEQGLTKNNQETIAEIDQQLESLEKELIDKANAGLKCEDLTCQIDALQEEKQKLLMEEAGEKGLHQRMQEIAEFLKGQETGIEEYDETLVRKLIEKITVYDDRCDVEFKSGIIVEVYQPS